MTKLDAGIVLLTGSFLVGVGIDLNSFAIGFFGFGLMSLGCMSLITGYLDKK